MARWGIASLVLLVGLGSGTGLYFLRASAGPRVVAATRTIRPQKGNVENSVNATGTIRLRVGSEVRVGSQLSGIVKKLNVTVGSHVEAGELIAQTDDAPLQARLAQAEAQVQLDHAAMERASVDAQRAQRLGSEGLIPIQQQQDLELQFEESKARHEKSLRDRDAVKVDLQYVQIRAPISGTVASVSTQEGETVAASFTTPTFVTIIRDNSLQLVAMVDETDIANVKRGNPVRFTVDSYPSRDFPGIVESVAPKATIVSGVVNYEVTVDIKKDANLLKPDMTANVSIETAQHEAWLLPSATVLHDGDQAFVYVSGSGGPQRTPVTVGAQSGEMVEIKKGVSPADEIRQDAIENKTIDQTVGGEHR